MSSDPTVGSPAGGEHHPRHRLDSIIHSPLRLSIMACLAPLAEAEFGFVRETVEVSPPTLSKQITILEEAGYVDVRKGYVGKRPRTWLALTPAGRQALAAHLGALRSIADQVTTAPAAGTEG